MNAPPPLVIFDSLERYIAALDDEVRISDEIEIRRLVGMGFPAVVSTRSLAVAFGYRAQFIGTMCRRPNQYYREFSIPKGSGQRRIQAPKVALKIIQKWFGHHIAKAVIMPDHVIGFVPGRSAISGAAKHCGAQWIFSSDIIDFFGTTSEKLVENSLLRIGYLPYAARLIVNLTCLNGFLAQGSPASPVLSNICFTIVDQQIFEYCEVNKLTYSRYADDIVISGQTAPPADLADRIRGFVQNGGWKIAEKKTRFSRQPYRLKVYGLIVNGPSPRLTKGYRNRIRAIQHLLDTGKLDKDREYEAAGHLSYAKSVETLSGNPDGIRV